MRSAVGHIRKLVSLSPQLVEAIKRYRHQHMIGAESEAIRQLIDRGLKQPNPSSAARRGSRGATRQRHQDHTHGRALPTTRRYSGGCA